jgi:hypothetical protein
MAKVTKILLAFVVVLGIEATAAAAQRQVLAQADTRPQVRESLLRSRNIAPTGVTLPHPGASKIGDESTQEKAAQRRSEQDTRSICSNCD